MLDAPSEIPMFLIPSRTQWKSWSMPSKLTAIGAYVGVVALALYLCELSFNVIGSMIPRNTNYFNVKVQGSIDAVHFLSNFVCMQKTKSNVVLSPIRLILNIEVTNLRNAKVRIQSYKCSGFYRVDSGTKSTEGWHKLYAMPIAGCTVLFIVDDLKKCTIVDYSKENFDAIASNTYIELGESIKGWMFFETDADIRESKIHLSKVKITIENSIGDTQTFVRDIQYNKDTSEARTYLPGMKFIGFYDLTQDNFSFVPMMDLRKDTSSTSK